MTGRQGRTRKQLLDDLKEKRRYWKWKEEALDRTVWRTRFGRGYGPVVRQTTEWKEYIYIYIYICIWQTSGVSYPHPNKTHKLHINTGPQTISFRVSAQKRVDLNPSDLYLWGHLGSLVYAAPIANKETLHQSIFCVKTFATDPGHFKVCDSPWPDTSKRELIQEEDILSICSELWLEKQYELNSY
jgi:hypothetical protein